MKAKKCNGTGVAAGYGCGQPNKFRKYGLGTECRCYQNWILNTESGRANLEKNMLRARKIIDREKRKEKKEFYEKNKSIAKLKSEARAAFQKWVRMRDANLLCISCGRDAETWDGGHYYKAELYSRLIFHPVNCNKQCKYCNKYLDGNESGYRTGLLKKYGQETIDNLDLLAVDDKKLGAYHWTREQLIEIKNTYLEKIKNKEFN